MSDSRLWLILAGVLLLAVGCIGSMEITGTLWQVGDDDDSSVDDDDSADDDDTVDDDDIQPDDDDMVGGPVFCGPEAEPGPDWPGGAAMIYTGEADIDVEYLTRGGVFTADWNGCEAVHFFDEGGGYICGVKWTAVGDSYGEQLQGTQLISRFDMAFELSEYTCDSSHPDVGDRQIYFRLEVPYGGPELTVTSSELVNTQPTQMDPWTTSDWDDSDTTPEEIDFDYQTAVYASGD